MDNLEYSIDNEQQFWDELEDIVSADCASHELIDTALRSFLQFTTKYKDEYLQDEHDFTRCLESILRCEIFLANKEYVRKQIIYSLLQEDEPATLYVISSFLLFDGREDETTFDFMNNEGCFPRLVDLIKDGTGDDSMLHRLLLGLLYEMSRMQRLSASDLAHVDDKFTLGLFAIIEELSNDVEDPYHYPVIRVLLVLNEQYMVHSTVSPEETGPEAKPLTNRVIKHLSLHGDAYMTFGENIILLLNRETETSLQLLILKLLYLIFTTPATYEYFYKNDLRVLLDVIIRNLLDLPNELVSLRHTYLRVMYPLLAHTQLNEAPHYKRDEIVKVLSILGGSANGHWEPADATTVRLVERVAKVPWIKEEDVSEGEVARKLLGISLSPTRSNSSISVVDVAAVSEKPGVQTPSRKSEITDAICSHDGVEDHADSLELQSLPEVRIKPPPPTRRRNAPPPAPPHILAIGGKKLPPKTPPRRRTKLKSMTSSQTLEDLPPHCAEDASTLTISSNACG